jgi:alkyl hydroperoxide reductase subunit AhpC
MPSLEELYQRFKSDNFDMLGISNDMFGERVVRPYVTAKKITFPMALDQRMVVSRQYGIVSLPTTILIDPQGIIIGVLQGAENWSDPETLLYFANLLKKN